MRYKETATKKASDSVKITIKVTSEYGVWVCGIPVNSQNENNVLGNTGIPTVAYDSQTRTLTLNNASIENTATSVLSMGSTKRNTDTAGIMSTEPLVINVIGDSAIRSDYGNAIKGENLTINSSNASKLTLDSYANMSAILVNTAKEKLRSLTITGNVEVTATITPKSEGNPSGQADGTAISAYDIIIQDEAKVTAVSKTMNLSIYYENTLTVKDSATLIAQSEKYDHAITVKNGFAYPNHSVTASKEFSGTPAETFAPDKLGTYKYVKVEPIPVSGVTLSKSSLSMKTNQTATLIATVNPSDALVRDVTWTSSTPSVATVDGNGVVTAVAPGTATITVRTKDGGYTAKCEVKVTDPTPAAITLDPTGTVTFPTAKVGYGDQEYKTVTVTNTGDLATGQLTIVLSGSDADKFELVANINSIAGGGAATFQVRPVTGSPVGTYTATVTVKTGMLSQSFDISFTVEAASKPSSGGGSSTTYYPVNIPAASEGGSVAVSPKSASRGSTVTVTVTPDSGYQVDQVQAVDKDGNKLTLTDKGDGKYTFVMPSGKVEVSASFSKVQQPENFPYRDVSKDSYYYDAVQWATDKGITNGVAEGLFAPDGLCTRGQIVTFLWRSVGSPAPKTAEMPFADVAENAYYAQAVLWALENGITKGTSETTFSPEQTCTRAQAVAFLYRLAGTPAVTGRSFQDVEADAYYSAAVAWAVQKGITNGTSETTFSPDQTCTRAQIVTFLYRMDQAK